MPRRALRGVLAALGALLVVLVGFAGPAWANPPGTPDPTPNGYGQYAVCNSLVDGPFISLACNYGITGTGQIPQTVEWGGNRTAQVQNIGFFGPGTMQVAGGPASGDFLLCYNTGGCLSGSIIGTNNTSPPSSEYFISGYTGVPDAINPDPMVGGLTGVRSKEVGYVEDGVGLVLAVVIAACGAGLLVKYARRAVRAS